MLRKYTIVGTVGSRVGAVATIVPPDSVGAGIQKLRVMEIKDNGNSFDVQRALHANGGKRFGLLCMRERVEMVGGTFYVESAPGQGTTIRAELPSAKVRKGPLQKSGKATLECP